MYTTDRQLRYILKLIKLKYGTFGFWSYHKFSLAWMDILETNTKIIVFFVVANLSMKISLMSFLEMYIVE